MHNLCGAIFRCDFIGMDAIQEGAGCLGAVRVLIGQGGTVALIVPTFARHYTGVTPDADIKVDHEAEFFVGMGGKLGQVARSFMYSLKSLKF